MPTQPSTPDERAAQLTDLSKHRTGTSRSHAARPSMEGRIVATVSGAPLIAHDADPAIPHHSVDLARTRLMRRKRHDLPAEIGAAVR